MAKTYQVDPAHSSITFTVKHMMISKVKGEFKEFDIEANGDPNDLANASVKVTIQAASVDTNNSDRDNHLRSGDFFNAEEYPHIVFQSTSFHSKGGGEFELTGDLTIRGTTREETFEVEYEGSAKDPWGNMKHAFSGEGSLNREDYGLTWNQALEAGGVLVDKKVKFEFELQFTESEA
ncbi:YceI family protein [Exiguobacterium aestuarii]|uniref:YceI family protein n=1 Tax=Exiguobacterium aestuarii TaxID=273527 RepID=A0ABW2PNT0_9BACL|nr:MULTISPECIES: YceI family protein [Exiguobacterium]MCT4787029.1 YceI family protein [Exiguobacterium aestuarii]